MPAILKGYFDRVWANNVAFTLPEGGGAIRPALTNIKKDRGRDDLRRAVVVHPRWCCRTRRAQSS